MDQQLFRVYRELFDSTKANDTTLSSDMILLTRDNADISFFVPLKISAASITNRIESNNDYYMISNLETIFTKQIQNYFSLSTKSVILQQIDDQIEEILIGNVFPSVETCYREAMKEILTYFEKQQRLQIFLAKKIREDNYADVSFFAPQFVDSSSESTDTSSTGTNIDQQSQINKQKQREVLLQA
ncbi:unnamed protein product [Rotaria sp. Silwood2]|nr:unnamed protein product [Rotaria sp. Silwood2]CAF3972825.1 unnamed protein product [Rotaria sp. Silwood2]CAF4089134.1 unnamed protein product [Rotaria sp. Silwood2]